MGWLKRKATEKQIRNTLDSLEKLIQVANEAQRSLDQVGTSTEAQRSSIHKLQKELMWNTIGPMSREELRKEVVDPLLARPEVSDGARMAVNHVFESLKE